MRAAPAVARRKDANTQPSRDAARKGARASDPLLRIQHFLENSGRSSLARDVRVGLTQSQKTIPAKYFYDERGAQLFDAICDLPEYYPTRTEEALLRQVAAEVIHETRPVQLAELGSGASRKTRVLLDAFTTSCAAPCYVPIDVSGGMLRRSATALRRSYPNLRVHGIVADYDRHLGRLPAARRRLLAFLGSTIGNFTPAAADAFLRDLASHLGASDFFFVGLDLVKRPEVLHAAYNDEQGLTAEFNRNVLHVLNREIGAEFDVQRFDHVAFFNHEEAQIEMHLAAREAHEVHVSDLGMTVSFAKGETIRTEISRKFTVESARQMLEQAGFRLHRWYTPPNGYFALALAARGGAA